MRSLLLRPRLFQLVSCALQRRDKVRAVSTRPWTPYRERVVTYNTSVGNPKITRTPRAEDLYALVKERLRGADVLIVGPRDVHELLMAWCYGATWDRITGIDLVSRNPKILVRDMAQSGFQDQSFDVIVASATISYLESVRDGLVEMRRVLRPGGLFAFTHAHDPQSDWHGNRVSAAHMLLLCEESGFTVRHHAVKFKISSQGRQVEILTCMVSK
mgnify:CR=1 FL=1